MGIPSVKVCTISCATKIRVFFRRPDFESRRNVLGDISTDFSENRPQIFEEMVPIEFCP